MKQSQEKQKRKVLFSYARQAFLIELPPLLFFACLSVLLCLALKDNQVKEEAPLELQKFRMELTFGYLSLARGASIGCSTKKSFQEPIHLGNLMMCTWTVTVPIGTPLRPLLNISSIYQ